MLFSEIFWLHAAMLGDRLGYYFIFLYIFFCLFVTVFHRDVGGGGGNLLHMYIYNMFIYYYYFFLFGLLFVPRGVGDSFCCVRNQDTS